MLEILRLRLVEVGVVHVSPLFVHLDTVLEVVLEHPLVVLGGPEDLDCLLVIAIGLRILLLSLEFHVRQVEEDEIDILDEFVKLALVALQLRVARIHRDASGVRHVGVPGHFAAEPWYVDNPESLN